MPRDALASYHFFIEAGDVQGAFRECAGLSTESEVIEDKTADKEGKSITRKIPGRIKYENITLKRGITDDMSIWKWRKQVEDGKVEEARRNGSVVMYDQANTEVARWNFEDGWPTKVSGPSLNAGNNEIAVEELVIAIEKLVRDH
jgi:phage tail-like protein